MKGEPTHINHCICVYVANYSVLFLSFTFSSRADEVVQGSSLSWGGGHHVCPHPEGLSLVAGFYESVKLKFKPNVKKLTEAICFSLD